MRKLLSANFARLLKNKVYWLAMAFMVIGSLAFSYLNYHTSLKFDDRIYYVEDVVFNLFPMLGFVSGIFISLFLGAEFEDKTIRNKLIVGHTRGEVFFANYLTCILGSMLLLAGMLLFSGIAGWIFFKEFVMSGLEQAFLLLCCILVTAVCSAIYVAISMNVQSRSTSVVISMVLILGLTFLASYIEIRLIEEEMVYSNVIITMEGVQLGDMIENPAYVDGLTRTIMEFFYDLLPTGQAAQINNMKFERCLRWPWLSALLLAGTTAIGFHLFKKRDIR